MSNIKIKSELDNLPKGAKWLHGEGAGCWFHIRHKIKTVNVFHIKRYNELGVEEFDLEFGLLKGSLNLDEAFEFDYPSHAKKCTIKQEGSQLILTRINV